MLGWLAATVLAFGAASSPAVCPTDPAAPAIAPTIAVKAGPGVRFGKVRYGQSVPLGDHELALTFDDGPDDEHTHQVLDILDRHCIKATFFLVGQEVAADPKTVLDIVARGHVVGAHSYTHPESMGSIPLDVGISEIDRSVEAIDHALADAPPESKARITRFFRFPEMNDSPALLLELDKRGLASMSADYGFDDWVDDLPPQTLYDRALLLTEERKKGVMLFHDYNPNMIAMLDRLLTTLEARGYHFVQLVEAK